METKKLIEKYRARLTRIGLVKSLVCALIAGFAVNFIVALVTWFLDLSLMMVLAISIGSGLGVALISLPVFYFAFFRPTTQGILRMVDGLGLEERMITMEELQNDESYIAMRQREDAKAKLQTVNANMIKYQVSLVAVVLIAVTFLFGISMTTVSSLAAAGIIKTGSELITPEQPEEPDVKDDTVTVTYIASEGGTIEGEAVQVILRGHDATEVTAVPDEGYVFLTWSDEKVSPSRWDWEVESDMTVIAVFLPQTEGGEGEGEGGPGEGAGDGAGGGGQAPEGGQAGEGEGEGNGNSGELDGDRNNQGGTGSGTVAKPDNNNVIDGRTDYKDEFNYDKVIEDLLNDNSISDEQKEFLKNYYESLRDMQNE